MLNEYTFVFIYIIIVKRVLINTFYWRKKIMRQKRFIAALLIAVMLIGVLAGCGKKEDTTELIVDGKKVKVGTIATIGDMEIPLSLFRYFYLSTKYQADQGDDSMWEQYPDYAKQLTDVAMNYCKNFATIHALCDKYNITLTDEDKKAIDDEIKKAIDNAGNYNAFIGALENNFMTEDMYKQMLEVEHLSDKLQEHLFSEGGEYYISDADFVKYIQDNFILSRHILISKSDEEAEEKIKAVREAIAAGDDFQNLAETYSADTASTYSYPDGTCYTEGEMVEEFYNCAFNTKVGEIGEVDEETYGYFFIQRLELTEKYINDNKDTLMPKYESGKMNTVVQDYIGSVDITYSEYYDKISIETLK